MEDNMKTKNIKFAAFLRYLKIHPCEVSKFSRGKAEYIYDISPEEWNKYKIDFNASSFLEYANCIEAIKDLAY